MKYAIFLLVAVCIVLGIFLTSHAASVFDKSHYSLDSHTSLHINAEYGKFMYFFPIALGYFLIAVVIAAKPYNKIPYIVIIIFTSSILITFIVNSLTDNQIIYLDMTTKYGEYLDFPLVKTIQTIALGLATYILIKLYRNSKILNI